MAYEIAKIIERDKALAASAAGSLDNRVLAFEKTENSDLVQCPPAITADFFAGLFSCDGKYWRTYEKFGLGTRPKAPYLYFFGGRMYFLKNLELECVFGAGPLKDYEIRNGAVELRTPLSLDSLLLLFAYPFDFARLSAATSMLALNTPIYLDEFEKFRGESAEFCANHQNDGEFDKAVFSRCMDGAMEAMEHSFFATLSYSLGLKFPKSPSWEVCDAEELGAMLDNPSKETKLKAISKFGFYALDVYDVQSPRLAEDFSANPSSPAPKNPQMRMRENAKFCLGRYFYILRKQLLLLADKTGFGDLVFHLNKEEILQLADGLDEKTLKEKAGQRKGEHAYLEKLGNSALPARFAYDRKNGRWVD